MLLQTRKLRVSALPPAGELCLSEHRTGAPQGLAGVQPATQRDAAQGPLGTLWTIWGLLPKWFLPTKIDQKSIVLGRHQDCPPAESSSSTADKALIFKGLRRLDCREGVSLPPQLNQVPQNRLTELCHLPAENSGRLASADLAKQTARLEPKCLQMFSLIVVLFSPYFSFDHFGTHSLSCEINNTSKLKRHIVHQGDLSGSCCDGPGPLSSSLRVTCNEYHFLPSGIQWYGWDFLKTQTDK